ncbi:plasma membrane calcium, partial [Coemansia sp. RSA 2611]
MVGDKDVEALRALGGTAGLLLGLGVNSDLGLVSAPSSAAAAGASVEPAEPVAVNSKADELARLLASEQGDDDLAWLAEFEADRKVHAERGDRYGINILPPAESRSFLGLVWDTLHDKMLILLIVAAIVSLGIGIYQDVRVTGDPVEDSQNVHWVEGFAIIVAISVITLVSSINDFQKEKQFRRLNAKKNNRRVRVTRGGQERLISTNCVLVGDIMHIEPGDIMCADAVVLSSSNLKCDESSVTGESDAIKKGRLEDAERASAEHKNRRQRRRAELRNKRNEQRAQALRLKEGSKPSEIEPIDLIEQSGIDADDSTDADDSQQPESTDIKHLSGDKYEGDFASQQQLLAAQFGATERRTKAHAIKRVDPFLISGSRVLEGVGR